MSEPQVASVSNEINQERVKKHRNEEFRDIEYYNRTMASLLGRDDHAKTIRVFHSIKEHDPQMKLTTQSYTLCLEALLALGESEQAELLYEEAKEEGMLSVALINVFLQRDAIDKNLEKLLENWMRMEVDGVNPDELSYVLKMKTLFHLNDTQGFYAAWEQMQSEAPHLITSTSYNLVALSLAHSKETDRLQELLSKIEVTYKDKAAIAKDPEIIQSILLTYGYHGDYSKLVSCLNDLCTNGTRITNAHCVAAMTGMCAASRATLAEKFIYQYVRKDLIRNKKAMSVNLRVLYRILLGECIDSRDAEVATRTFEAIVSSSVPGTDSFAFETKCMVQLHLERDEEASANRYFEKYLQSVPLRDPTPLAFDLARIYINHYVESQEPSKALRFWQTHEKQLADGHDKMRLGLEAYASAGDTKSARKLFDQLLASGVLPTPEMCQLVMRAYVNANDPKRAITMFEETQENGVAPTVGSYNIVAGVYASRGDIAKTQGIIESMEKDGFVPNAQSYSHLMSAYVHSRKWETALQVFETHFKIFSKNSSPSSQSASATQANEAAPSQSSSSKFKPSANDFATAFICAQQINDKQRVADYWYSMKAMEGQLGITHLLPALSAAATQTPLFVNILQLLQKRILKSTFKLSYDQTKQLAKIINLNLVSQHSPLWPELSALSQLQGRNQLSWDKRKDWATIIQKAIYEWTSTNPQ
jgi:pentatricopeptide repeat protein